jgi:ribosome-binding protein aMBF1 (putative translation factor)
MRRTIQELREEHGTSRAELAAAIGVTTDDVTDWEMSRAEPTVSRFRVLTQYFGVRDDQLNLRPSDPPSFGDRLAKLL